MPLKDGPLIPLDQGLPASIAPIPVRWCISLFPSESGLVSIFEEVDHVDTRRAP